MKAVVKTTREPGIELLDVKTPPVGDTDILVRVKAGSLCGSDIHIYEWTPSYEWILTPVTLGHEFSGEVAEVGSEIETIAVGDRVTAMPFMPCAKCPSCRAGKGESCINRAALGLTMDGAFAEYVRITAGANIFKLPDELSYETAALCEPFSVALQAVDISNIRVAQKAAILGPGPIGLFTLQLLKAAGAGFVLVAGTSGDRERLKLAERLGADVTINVEEQDPVEKMKELTGSDIDFGLDFVFEATGNPKSVPQALDMVKMAGKVILIGIHSGPAQFNPTELVRSKKSIIGAYGYQVDTWQRVLHLFSTEKVQVKEVITHQLPLSEARKGFELAMKKEAIKVLFIP